MSKKEFRSLLGFSRVFILSFLIVSFLMVNQSTAQQKTGRIRGTVKDETATPLPGVSIEIRGEALMGSRAAITDKEGEFAFLALPVGRKYEVTFSLDGFQTYIRKNLRITIGSTIVLDIVLKPSVLEEEVVVTAEASLVDVAKSSFSSSFDKEDLETLPTRRKTFFDMLWNTPGVTPAGPEEERVSAFGSGSEDNAYYMNGVDISAPSTGAAWAWPMPDVIEEIEITGVGAPAEYGNFTGAVVNVISKSGSNTLHGAVKFFFQHEKLTANNTPDEEWPFYRDHWHDVIFQLSGPIVKDKVWFFGSLQHLVDRKSDVGVDPAYPTEYAMTPTAVAKLDFQVNKSNKITLWVHYENYYFPWPVRPLKPYETVTAESAPCIAPTVDWLSTLNESTYFELKYGGFYTFLKDEPLDGDMTTPGRRDWATDMRSVNAMGYYHWKTNRTQVNATLTHYAQEFLGGDHEFKFGVQYNHGYSKAVWWYFSGKFYYDWEEYPYVQYYRLPALYAGVVNQIGAFVDDSWSVGNRLTFNLGLRFDHNKGSIPDLEQVDVNNEPTGTVIPGISDAVNWSNFSPRIGLNYQITSDRKTLFRATYGRYYNALIVGDIDDITPARTTLYASWYNWDTGVYDIPAWTWEPLSQSGLDPSLKPEYSDQFSAALEREVFSDFSLSGTFIYKQTKNIIGLYNTTAQYTELPVLDEYSGNIITLYNTTDGKYQYLTNPGDESTYKAFMLVANKRFSHNFQFYSSFTWSEARYQAKGYIDKNELINAEDAPRWRDRRWMAKFGGVYNAPLGIVIGTNITWQQGLPWARQLRVAGLLDQGWGAKTVYAEPFGSRRYPNNFFCDIKIEKAFHIGDRFRIMANFDILNLFNMDTNLEWVSEEAQNAYWMVPTGIILPRRVIVGVRLEF
jgi:hypothetical protein